MESIYKRIKLQPQAGQELLQTVNDWKEVDSQVSERALFKSNFSKRRPYMKRKKEAIGLVVEPDKRKQAPKKSRVRAGSVASPIESE